MKVEDLSAAAYFTGWRIVRWLPEKSAYRLFSFVADRVSAKNGKNFQRLESNLKRVIPELTETQLHLNCPRANCEHWRKQECVPI